MSTTVQLPSLDGVRAVSDARLQQLHEEIGAARRRVDAALAVVAGEAARRSAAALGQQGLAARAGARSPEAFVARLTGTMTAEARALVQVGGMLGGDAPWLAAVADRVAAGSVSVTAAAGIGTGLGAPTAEVAEADLAAAAEQLLTLAPTVAVDRVAAHARAARDELDAAGVADREQQLRQKRFLRLRQLPDGMTAVHGLLDPASAAVVSDAFDAVTAPRRGGVRFVDPADAADAGRVVADPRTTDQLMVDTLVQLITLAGTVDDGTVFGTRKPGVRIHATLNDLERGAGVARIEGQSAAVSIGTAAHELCTTGGIVILFDRPGGAILNLGRTRRTFTDTQRIALAAIWGGCADPDCDRPPSWCEAHHIDQWDRDRGPTDLDNGILLCRFHHLRLHTGHWTLHRHPNGTIRMLPPPGDPTQHPTTLHRRGSMGSRTASGAA